MTKKTVWQHEKISLIAVSVNLQNDRVYGKGKKSDMPDENLFSYLVRFTKKSWCLPRFHHGIV